MGGTDDEENLTPPISIELHAEFHKDLWIHYKDKRDYIAWKCLSGRMTGEEARIKAAKIGQSMSVKYKESRKITGEFVKNCRTYESCSKGGKIASKKLVEWQLKNKELFAKQCAENAKKGNKYKFIQHLYKGIIYNSKKELQIEHKMSNCGFYGKLKRGEIIRIGKIHVKQKRNNW
jgi:hypothetical protein